MPGPREALKESDKQFWRGRIVAVPPRIRLTRPFNERYHGYLGYLLRVQGEVGGAERELTVGIGKAAQAKHGFRAGYEASGHRPSRCG